MFGLQLAGVLDRDVVQKIIDCSHCTQGDAGGPVTSDQEQQRFLDEASGSVKRNAFFMKKALVLVLLWCSSSACIPEIMCEPLDDRTMTISERPSDSQQQC